MDYYNLTVFEWVTDHLGSQGTVCGGGRYDGLFEQLGGKPTPSVGFGLGVERLLLLIQALGVPVPPSSPTVYAIMPSEAGLPTAMGVLEAVRSVGVSVQMNPCGASIKSQFKKADASGARFALVFGSEELARSAVSIKPLREAEAAQTELPLTELSNWAQALLSA